MGNSSPFIHYVAECPPAGHPGHEDAQVMEMTTKKWFRLRNADPVLLNEACDTLVRFGGSFVWQCKERPQHFFADCDFDNPDPSLMNMDPVAICQAWWWGLGKILGDTFLDRHKKKHAIVLVTGCRPGKFSYHVHFPFLRVTKARRGEMYDRLIDLVNHFPTAPEALFLASVIDPAVKGGGLYLPFTHKPNTDGSNKRFVAMYSYPSCKADANIPPIDVIKLCMMDLPREDQIDVKDLIPVRGAPPRPPPIRLPTNPLAPPEEKVLTRFLNSTKDFEGWSDGLLERLNHPEQLIQYLRETFVRVGEKIYALNDEYGSRQEFTSKSLSVFDRKEWIVADGSKKGCSLPKFIQAYTLPYEGFCMRPYPVGKFLRVVDRKINTWRGFRVFEHYQPKMPELMQAEVIEDINHILFHIWRDICSCHTPSFKAFVVWLGNKHIYPPSTIPCFLNNDQNLRSCFAIVLPLHCVCI